MTKAELIQKVLSQVEGFNKKDLISIIEKVFSTMSEQFLSGDRLHLSGFGTFTVKKRTAREGRNPRTGEKVRVPPRTTVTFKLSPKLKAHLNKDNI